MDERLSVLVVDDHEMVRDGLAAVMQAAGDIDVVGQTGTVSEALDLMTSEAPDVVVTDYQLSDGLGLEIARAAAAAELPAAVLLISGVDRPGLIDEAVQAGCVGFLSKGRGLDELVDAVRAVAGGAAVFPADALRRVVRGTPVTSDFGLTDREMQVLEMLTRPLTVEELADELVISVHTARNHVRSVLMKLQARSQLEAVVLAVRHDLVEIR